MDQLLTITEVKPAPPCTVVIFGASGDLARRKLLPALYNLSACGRAMLAPNTAVLGFARRPMTLEAFRNSARDAIERFSRLEIEDPCWQGFAASLDYLSGLDQPDGFARLRKRLEETERARGIAPNRVYYLSIPPEAIIECVERLSQAGLIAPPGAPHFTRLVVEKPIGSDLESALAINRALERHLAETQIFRIDHYLGKETVQNLLVLRFANSIFEDIWGNRHIDHVQITVAESEGVGTRAMYYEPAGALRDMVQNHMLQLLSMLAMEPPVSLAAGAISDAKLNVLSALRPIRGAQVAGLVVRGRYTGGSVDGVRAPSYLEEPGVPQSSRTETFVALKALVDNWRWSGVPFYMRTGKRLARRASSIFVQFKAVPGILFNRDGRLFPDVMAIRIQPDEGFSFEVLAKQPGLDLAIRPVRMNLRYESEFGLRSPDAYERLLLDVMEGDRTLFLSDRFVEQSWEFVQGILDQWSADSRGAPADYPAGSWGPAEAERLLAVDRRAWRQP